ncbi:PDE12 [Symbiodinium necroappetens]|uniref:PDE12 protein n=1 Tax=Symbiodinium necroappetens TaxID=1628268 RepID=A0A812Z2P9_9DINO|nr:PDE12 [Symbiodinium necroappetens]
MALAPSSSGPSDISLADVLREVSDIMSNPRSWENRRETIFELLRRSLLQSGRNDSLDSKLHGPDSSIETAWLFLLTLRRRSPVRQRRIDECLRALRSSDRWMQILRQSSRAQELLGDQTGALPAPLSDLEGVDVAETAHEAHPRFGNLSPKAMAGTAVFSAAMQATSGPSSPAGGASPAQDRDRNGDRATDKIEEGAKEPQHHVTSKVVGATQSAFQAARDTNQKYGVTDKIGEGAKSAYTKARDFEQQHHVTSKVASGLKAGISGAASAAGSLAKGSNPFTHSATSQTEVNSRNPFREVRNGNPFR